ncbi:DUF2946 family protein [Pigmentiphaga soli]
MDDNVVAAMARWPNVPDAFGWLSLDRRGRWRLHARGDAARGGTGEEIAHPGVQAFIGRNYLRDDAGRWYFQNGPQRVFLRLDGAPLILRTGDTGAGLVAHTGAQVSAVHEWAIDADGNLYAATDLGPGLVEDRDLERVLDGMTGEDGRPLDEAAPDWLQRLLEGGGAPDAPAAAFSVRCRALPDAVVPLRPLAGGADRHFGFVANPQGSESAGDCVGGQPE